MTNEQPLISIIVPVYNANRHLDKCMESLLRQTLGDFEIVLVDDGSHDGSGEKCDDYAAGDRRVKVVHKQNAGVAEARVTGFETSRGRWVAFVDADDFVAPDFLEKMSEACLAGDPDMVSCRYFNYTPGAAPRTISRVTGYFERDDIDVFLQKRFLYDRETKAAGMPIALWAKLIKREFVASALKAGCGLRWSEDQIGLFNILLNIRSFCAIPDSLYYYVQHDGQVTRKYDFVLWEHQLEAYSRYRKMDTRHLLSEQLFLRTWLFTVKAITTKRMPQALGSRQNFCREMRRVEKIPAWKEFMSSRMSTTLGKRNNLQFWLLRMRMYGLYYRWFCTRRRQVTLTDGQKQG